MSTPESARAISALARLTRGFRQWRRGSMPDCGCSAQAAAEKMDKPLDKAVEPVTVARKQAAYVEQDPERLARVAMYALGGYFHSGCLGDMFVCTPDVWIERVGDRS